MTDLEMMYDHEKWPQWPWLPLKKKERGRVILGVLLASVSQPFTIFLANLWETPQSELPKMPSKVYSSYEAIIADEWVVD